MPSRLQRPRRSRAEPRHVLGVLRERAIADHRVLRIGVDVEDRRVVEGDADRLQLGGQRAREPLGQRVVAAPPERRHRRPLGERRLQPRDPPAFLIDRHPERQSGTSRDASNDSSATCSGSTTLRAKRMTPPRLNSRRAIAARSESGAVEAGDQQLPICAKRSGDIA
jgi:hypothetical protein